MRVGWFWNNLLLAMLANVLAFGGIAFGQSDRPSLAGAGGASGIGQYSPEQWGVAATTIRNPTDQDQNLRVTLSFDDSANLEFATDVWLPAWSRRRIWMPIRTNEFEIQPFETNTLKLKQRLYDLSGETPIQIHELSGLLIATRDRFITGMLADSQEIDADSVRASLAARRSMEYSGRMAYLRENDLPTMVAGWRGMNSLVLSKDTPELDTAQLAAMRQWLLDGGRLWVMAEQVDSQFMHRLLGEEWTLEVVDHVPLSRVRMNPGDKEPNYTVTISDDGTLGLDGREVGKLTGERKSWQPLFQRLNKQLDQKLSKDETRGRVPALLRVEGAATGEMVDAAIRSIQGVTLILDREHEDPVDMARVLAPDMDVTASVNGWPAALRKPIGRGWLMVTTIGPRAWMEPVWANQVNVDGTERKTKGGQNRLQQSYAATPALESLANWFMRDERTDPLPSREFDTFVSNQIGREIVGRGTITIIFAGFTFALLIGGLWLAKKGRLELVVGVGVTGALLATVVLLLVGRAKRVAVPSTVALSQFIQIAPGQQHAVVNGWMQVYNPGVGGKGGDGTSRSFDPSNAHFEATAGGLILPGNLDELGSRRVTMVWNDMDRWNWRNVTLPSGQSRSAAFEHTTPLDQPVRAVVTFDESGLVGRLESGDLGDIESLLIVTPAGHLATTLDQQNTFRSSADSVLPSGQYFAAGVLDSLQQQRQGVYQRLLDPRDPKEDREKGRTGSSAKTKKSAGSDPTGAKSKTGKATRRPSSRQGVYGKRTRTPYPRQPMLLGWSKALPLGFELPATEQRLGAALVAIPLSFERPAHGTTVTVPTPLIPFESVRGRGSLSPFDRLNRQWIPLTTGGTSRIIFTLPQVLNPLRLESATFNIEITALERNVTIRAAMPKGSVELRTLESPSGRFEVAVPSTVQPDADGRISIEIVVSELASGQQGTWHIQDVSMQVTGVVEGAKE